MEVINIEKRIEDMIEFFIKEEIAHPALTVTFEDDEPTCYNSDISININFRQLIHEGDSGDLITCKGVEYLLDTFNSIEIAFFHELGHHCDLYHRLNFDKKRMVAEIEESNKIFEPVHLLMRRMNRIVWSPYDIIIKKKIEAQAFHVYRTLPIEQVADENARLLMQYYVEHAE